MNTRSLLCAFSAGALLCLSLSGHRAFAQDAATPPAAEPPAKAKPAQADTPLAKEIAELDALRAEIQKSKGEEKSRKTAEFLSRAKELAEGYIKDLKYDEAGKILQTTSSIVASSKTGLAEDVSALARDVPKKKNAANRVTQLTAKFDKAKPDAKNAKIIVDLYAFDLQMPEKALEYAEFTGDKTLAAKLKLAATPLDSLDSTQLVDLGDFYTQAAKNNLPQKTQLASSARSAYEKALEKGIKDEKTKKRVESATMSEKEKSAGPTTPVGELNHQIVQFYQGLPREFQTEGAFTDEQKKAIATQAKSKFEGRVTTVGGVITAVTPGTSPTKDKAVLTLSLDLQDITDRTVTVSVIVTVSKADESKITAGGQLLASGRITAIVLNNSSNTVKMSQGEIKAYKPDPNASTAEPAKPEPAKKK
jgi:hypothetical protein